MIKKMKGIIVSGGAKTKREIVPSGTHVARCYSNADALC